MSACTCASLEANLLGCVEMDGWNGMYIDTALHPATALSKKPSLFFFTPSSFAPACDHTHPIILRTGRMVAPKGHVHGIDIVPGLVEMTRENMLKVTETGGVCA